MDVVPAKYTSSSLLQTLLVNTCVCCVLQKMKLETLQSNRITSKRIPQPRNRLKLLCYSMCMHPAFDIVMYIVIVINIVAIVTEFEEEAKSLTPDEERTRELLFFVFNVIFIVIYILEAIIKVRGRHNLRTHARTHTRTHAHMHARAVTFVYSYLLFCYMSCRNVCMSDFLHDNLSV